MQDGHVETGLGSQIAELISDAGCCPHLGRFSPRNFLKRQRPQVTRPVAARKDVQAYLQQVRHAQMWEAAMQRNAPYVQHYKHLHRLSIYHQSANMQNAAECIYTFVDRDTCQLQLAFRWARFSTQQPACWLHLSWQQVHSTTSLPAGWGQQCTSGLCRCTPSAKGRL